jgi:hypothetical protein
LGLGLVFAAASKFLISSFSESTMIGELSWWLESRLPWMGRSYGEANDFCGDFQREQSSMNNNEEQGI